MRFAVVIAALALLQLATVAHADGSWQCTGKNISSSDQAKLQFDVTSLGQYGKVYVNVASNYYLQSTNPGLDE